MFFKRKKEKAPHEITCRDMTPEVRISVRAANEGVPDCQRIHISMYNVKLSYMDERGSRFSSDHTSISLDLHGISSWISLGLFTEREQGDPECQIPFLTRMSRASPRFTPQRSPSRAGAPGSSKQSCEKKNAWMHCTSSRPWRVRRSRGGAMKLTASQAAKLAGVSRSLIYQLCEERRLPQLRLGSKGHRGRILIEESDLIAFLERCRVESETDQPATRPAMPVASIFRNLDSDRLLEAWKRRGVISSPQDEHGSP